MANITFTGPVVVLYGGPSSEAAVSKETGKAMMTALENLNIKYQGIEYKENTWINDLERLNPSFVLNAMHGTPGEDGTVQAVLRSLNIPFNGSGVRASAKAMNKSYAKTFFSKEGLDVAKEICYTSQTLPESSDKLALPLPVVMKPNNGGSSVGVHLVFTESDYQKAKADCHGMADDILMEEYIAGRELSVPVFDGEGKGVIEMVANGHEFYDYEAKYAEGGSSHIFPASIATEVYELACNQALKAHNSLGCKGVTRVDFRYDEESKRLVVLEVNTLPGMTQTSLVPEVAAHKGMSFEQLIMWMIEDGTCQKQNVA